MAVKAQPESVKAMRKTKYLQNVIRITHAEMRFRFCSYSTLARYFWGNVFPLKYHLRKTVLFF